MTDRLYYTDPALVEFDATVTAATEADSRWRVELDRTAFYPTSGGQPHDLGALGSAKVIDVADEEGRVIHIVDAPLATGQSVHGTVDRARRLDHMHQHTGQHVLSAAFSRLLDVRTVSFHLGSSASTIDLAREVTPDETDVAESEANRIVRENRTVTVRFVTAEEASRLTLRKEPVREGELRLIDIDDFDLSACGGTHVGRTGEIGLIAVVGYERFKGGTRLEFVCGARALTAFRELRSAVAASVRQLSVLPAELPGAIERMQGEARDLRRQLRGLTEQLARYHAQEMVGRADRIGGHAVVIEAVAGYDAAGLKAMAAALVVQPGRIAVLLTAERPSLIVVARSADVSLDVSALLRQLVSRFGGKGGGKPEMAQGGGLDRPIPDIVAAARELIAHGTSTAAGGQA
jgi:alanyl-tRNA synthetase